MDLTLLIVAGFLSVLLATALVLSRRSAIAGIVTSIFSFGFAAFCGFGFLACFEPSSSPMWPWQLAYVIIGVGFLIAALRGVLSVYHRLGQARGSS